MEIYVDGKKFEDYNEAKAYEDNLLMQKALGRSRIAVKDYFLYLYMNNMLKFRKVVKDDNEYYVTVITNSDNLSKVYIDTAIEHIFGSRYSFDDTNSLYENYKVFSSFKEGLDGAGSVEEISYKVADAKHFIKLNKAYTNDNLYIFVQDDNLLKPLVDKGSIVIQHYISNRDISGFFNALFGI